MIRVNKQLRKTYKYHKAVSLESQIKMDTAYLAAAHNRYVLKDLQIGLVNVDYLITQ